MGLLREFLSTSLCDIFWYQFQHQSCHLPIKFNEKWSYIISLFQISIFAMRTGVWRWGAAWTSARVRSFHSFWIIFVNRYNTCNCVVNLEKSQLLFLLAFGCCGDFAAFISNKVLLESLIAFRWLEKSIVLHPSCSKKALQSLRSSVLLLYVWWNSNPLSKN